MNISGQTVKDIFDKAFSQKGNKPFIVFGNRKVTYGELKSNIGKYSTYFQNNNLKCGDRVILASTDESFVCQFYLSLIANGITAVLLNHETGSERANAIIQHTQATKLFVDSEIQKAWNLESQHNLTVVSNDSPGKKGLFNKLRGKESPLELFPACTDNLTESKTAQEIDPETDAYILYTSGTTSSPKGVRISYRALFSHLQSLSDVYQMNSSEVKLFNNLILSHADGMIQGPLLALYNAATIFRPFPFSIQHIEEMFDVIYREEITHWVMVPTMIGLIYQFKQKDNDTLDNNHFRYVISCGGKLESLLWQQFEEKFRTRIINGYGLTETVAGGLFAGPGDDSHVIGTIGKPVDCEVRIMDDNLKENPINVPGEIWLKGSLLMSGYLNDPSATSEVFDGEWFKTGDIGYKGDDGLFRITGRKKLIIISGGLNISPEEVTEVLKTHPAVQDGVTFGIEDNLWGEIVASAILLKPSFSLTKEALIEHCRIHLEEKKVPSKIYFVDELPYGLSGKVSIPAIKEKVREMSENTISEIEDNNAFFSIISNSLQLPLDAVSMDMEAEETPQWDSIAHLILIAQFEKHYTIEFTPMEVMNVNKVADLYDLIEKKTK